MAGVFNTSAALRTPPIAGVSHDGVRYRQSGLIRVIRLQSGAQRYGGGTPRDSAAFTREEALAQRAPSLLLFVPRSRTELQRRRSHPSRCSSAPARALVGRRVARAPECSLGWESRGRPWAPCPTAQVVGWPTDWGWPELLTDLAGLVSPPPTQVPLRRFMVGRASGLDSTSQRAVLRGDDRWQ